ncbi:helix-turn-helix domain-containing protein [Scandinavium sp. NPDC088450]|uniref:helix-turn-helix domain-containing protein n=1 Tax=Scandinavium sp. NPDC088450 TaxID=3364514 RepID=UPI00384F97A6
MNETLNINSNPLAAEMLPCEEITALMTPLSADLPRSVAKRSEVLKYTTSKNQMCIVLHKGSMALRRRGDGMVVSSEQAPFIFGLGNQPETPDTMYLQCLEECEISFVPLRRVNEIVAKEELWEPFVKVLLYTISKIYEHCTQVHQMSAYDIIRYQLYELMKESETVRQSTTVAKYIKNRTYLSRSGIMRILSELRTGQYIQIENGFLMGITNLPKKY